MTQAVQARQKVKVRRILTPSVTFTIPEDLLGDLLPEGRDRITLFRSDRLESIIGDAGHPKLNGLCRGLMPGGNSDQIDHIRIVRIKGDKPRTDFTVQLVSDKLCNSSQGRIDAALRSCGFEPEYKI